jgi:hypothetical protein
MIVGRQKAATEQNLRYVICKIPQANGGCYTISGRSTVDMDGIWWLGKIFHAFERFAKTCTWNMLPTPQTKERA